MKALIKSFIEVFKGNETVDHQLKYKFVFVACILVHIILVIIFALLGIFKLSFFNVCSVAGYILCWRWVEKEVYEPAYYYTCVEITAHAILAAITVGWDCGFSMYIIAFVPVTLYMQFNMDRSLDLRRTYFNGIYQAAAYVMCRIFTLIMEPFEKIADEAVITFYLFNSVCAFAMITLFSIMFMLEIRSSHMSMQLKNEELDKMASIDTLTGLLNRRSMMKCFDSALEGRENFSVIMCDVDNFKKINDTYGHDCGDVVLKEISMAVASCLRENDSISRWGGEEILIMINDAVTSEAVLIAERIRKKVERREIKFNDRIINCTITIGVADLSQGGSIEHTITIADERLYRGKTGGKNCVISTD